MLQAHQVIVRGQRVDVLSLAIDTVSGARHVELAVHAHAKVVDKAGGECWSPGPWLKERLVVGAVAPVALAGW